MHLIRRGSGKPLLLVHGLGGSWRSWLPVLDHLAGEREVIAVDLPGFGQTPPLSGQTSIRTLADTLALFLAAEGLTGVDAAGSSMGGRLVLELARRGGVLGATVALGPGGFWRGWQRHYLYGSLSLSARLVRRLQPVLPQLAGSAAARTALLAQLSAHPWRLSPALVLSELRGIAASPSFDELLHRLAYGEPQQGAPRGSIRQPLVIGWGRRDRVCLPGQAQRAVQAFPDAHLHWFRHSGHFPQWDAPWETCRLILTGTRGLLPAGGTSGLPAEAGLGWAVRAGQPAPGPTAG